MFLYVYVCFHNNILSSQVNIMWPLFSNTAMGQIFDRGNDESAAFAAKVLVDLRNEDDSYAEIVNKWIQAYVNSNNKPGVAKVVRAMAELEKRGEVQNVTLS